ncbi:hypothetical protein Tco_0497491 [Tanacetum coccineum]
MAALRYRDEHNKVGYLQQPKGNDDYHQILDFLEASHIRYALTHDPIIFDSLVKQFWSTATLMSSKLGPPAILATIDKTPYTITEESVKRHLQLADDGGIDDLPIVEIYFGMDNLGYVTEGKLTFFKNKFSPQWRFLVHTLLHCLSTKSEGEGAGVDVQAVPPPISVTIPETRHEFDHSQDHVSTPIRPQVTPYVTPIFEHDQQTVPNIASSSRIHEPKDDSLGGSLHVSPPRFTQASPTAHASEGTEDHITLFALSSAVSTLVKKVHFLETELQAHKKLFKDVVPKLVKKVKALEVQLKSKKRKVVLSDSYQEEGGKPDVDLDALNALANATVTVDSTKSPGGPSRDSTTEVPSTEFPTDIPSGVAPTGPSTVSPGSTTVPTSSSVPAAETIPASSGTTTATPSSPQLEKERLGWEVAQRLQAQELADFEKQRAESLMSDANLARQMSPDFKMTEDQRKRQQEVLASATNYSDAAWDIILARLQANPDLSSTIFGVDDLQPRWMLWSENSMRKELLNNRLKNGGIGI